MQASAATQKITTANPALPRWLQIALLSLCCLPFLAATLSLTFRRNGALCDFTAYWGAARVFLAHQNPYAAEPLLTVQRSVGWLDADPIRVYNPPWTLPIFAPFGFLPFPLANAIWLALSLAIELLSALALWIYFGGTPRTCWVAPAIALTFLPLGVTNHYGQITPLILVGLVAFLLLARAQRWFAAGASLLLVLGIKPHLFWLVAAAVLLWIIQERRWRLLSGALFAFAAAMATVCLVDPPALHYFTNIYSRAMDQVCGLGGGLRLLFGLQHTWLQYLPCVPGAAWFLWYWSRHRQAWNWPEHLPLLLLVSFASSPYGWSVDYMLALPAFIALAARGAWRSPMVIVSWLLVQLLVFASPVAGIQAAVSVLWCPFWILASLATQPRPQRVPAVESLPAPQPSNT
jgi:hypothetical protein